MAIDPAYRAEIEEKLSAVCNLRTRPMFGGLGIYADDFFFALADDGKLYLKVDSSNQGDFEARGMQPFVPFGGSQPMGYWELPHGVIDDPKELSAWVDKAVRVAERAKKPKKRSAT
jgi:DNA transformation protein and related proteins